VKIKKNHVDVCKELVDHENGDESFVKIIVTHDETWV
jgi:hypothetical protein